MKPIDLTEITWERYDEVAHKKKRFRPRETNLSEMNRWVRGLEVSRAQSDAERRAKEKTDEREAA